MSWQTCIACRAGIWSHLPTLWPGWLGADWCYLACFGNQFLSATHLYPKTIVAWFRVVSCLVEKHVSGDFFGLQYVLSLPNWQRCWRNWMSSPCPWLGLSHDFEAFWISGWVFFSNWISFKSSGWLEDSRSHVLEEAGLFDACALWVKHAIQFAVPAWSSHQGDCRSGQGFLEVVTVVAPGKWKYLTNIRENMRSYLPSQVPIPGAICGNGQPITYNLIFFLIQPLSL